MFVMHPFEPLAMVHPTNLLEHPRVHCAHWLKSAAPSIWH